MKIRLVFDGKQKDPDGGSTWGLAYLINDDLLFDAGGDRDLLLTNLDSMGVDCTRVSRVVISHEHDDHMDGLWGLFRCQLSPQIYICPEFSELVKEKIRLYGGNVVENTGMSEIDENIFVTGGLEGTHKKHDIFEQALVLRTAKGISVITGCAHPGIDTMLHYIYDYFKEPFYAVMGGFHLYHKHERDIERILSRIKVLGVQVIAPTHCTGEKGEELIASTFSNEYKKLSLGDELVVS